MDDDLFYSSSVNETGPDTKSDSVTENDDKSYTYVTCDRVVNGRVVWLSCHIGRNDSSPDTCVEERMSRCHYKAVSRGRRTLINFYLKLHSKIFHMNNMLREIAQRVHANPM